MSVSVYVITQETVAPLTLRSRVESIYPDIQIPDCGEQVQHFHIPEKSIRPVEVSKEDAGYEVRILSWSSADDWRLFRDLISILQSITNGEIRDDDEDGKLIMDVTKEFSDEEIAKTLEGDYSLLRTLSSGHEVDFEAVNRKVCAGEHLFAMAGIKEGMDKAQAATLFQKYVLSLQWNRRGHISTRTPACFAKVTDKNGEERSISTYLYSNDNPDRFDYIYKEPFFSLFDADKKDGVVIKYENLHKIVPSTWVRFDREQYDCKPLTREEFDAFFQRAKKYDIYQEEEEDEDIRHIYISTENCRVSIDAAQSRFVIRQGNTQYQLPKFVEYQLIYLLYKKKDRIEAARLLQKMSDGDMMVEKALGQFEEEHPLEPLEGPFEISQLEPLAPIDEGLKVLTDGKTVTIPADGEQEILSILKERNYDGITAWFERFLKANGYEFQPFEYHKHAQNLTLSYLHYQALDLDENDPVVGYDKKKTSVRFWLFMFVFIAAIWLLFKLFGRLFQ